MAAPYAPPNSPFFTTDERAITTRSGDSTPVVTDDLRATIIANLMDGINAAWNGWECACRFQDEGMQSYYMKYINVLSNTLEKVRKF